MTEQPPPKAFYGAGGVGGGERHLQRWGEWNPGSGPRGKLCRGRTVSNLCSVLKEF